MEKGSTAASFLCICGQCHTIHVDGLINVHKEQLTLNINTNNNRTIITLWWKTFDLDIIDSRRTNM